jgi:cytochrome c-type protein NapB
MRTLSLGTAFILAIALVGFLRGITEVHPTVRASAARSEPAVAREVPDARAYRDMAATALGPNRDWASELSRLKFDRPGQFDPVQRTEAEKMSALADRARRRAFEGAPPVVPHAIEQQSAASCLACHGSGLKLGDKLATKMSHRFLTNCTQCHVESQSAAPVEAEALAENQFVGRARSGPGRRALVGSPPTIPHTTWMREDCLSCHGLVAREGLRTTHPWLTNCVQCHALSAELDQLPTRVTESTLPATVTRPSLGLPPNTTP